MISAYPTDGGMAIFFFLSAALLITCCQPAAETQQNGQPSLIYFPENCFLLIKTNREKTESVTNTWSHLVSPPYCAFALVLQQRAHWFHKQDSHSCELQGSGALQFPGGVPTSLRNSGQQWDYPNAWAPLQHMLIEGRH